MSGGGQARIGSLFALLFLLCAGPGLRAQEYQVTAFVRPNSDITDDRPIQLIVQVEGAGNPQVRPPAIPALKNLRLIGGPDQRSQFSWRNGVGSSQYQLVYTLMAKGPGPAEIPALEVVVDGTTHGTAPILFRVKKAATGPPAGPKSSRPAPAQADDRYDVFLRAELGAREVWVGQPVPLNVTLFTAERIADLGWPSLPGFADFWVETLEVDAEAEAFRTQVNGRPYTAFPIDRRVLVPPSPGRFEIEPYVAQLRVRRAGDSPFGFFSFDRGDVIIRRTEPLALRATVEGEGFLRAVEPPVFDAPPDVKLFEPKVSESTSEISGRVTSKKSWEWILVPLAPGELTLPELHFPYFDPARGEYRTARSGPLELAVRRAEAGPDAPQARGEIQLQRRDLAFIKPRRGQLSAYHARAHQQGLFVTLLLLPFALFPLVVVLGRRRARLRQDLGLARARKAAARTRKRLRAARRRLEQADSAAFHEELARTLVEYVADRFNRSAAGLTYEAANELLASKGVSPEARRRFRACLESCDFARFVPAAAKSERRAELLDSAAAVVEELEKAW